MWDSFVHRIGNSSGPGIDLLNSNERRSFTSDFRVTDYSFYSYNYHNCFLRMTLISKLVIAHQNEGPFGYADDHVVEQAFRGIFIWFFNVYSRVSGSTFKPISYPFGSLNEVNSDLREEKPRLGPLEQQAIHLCIEQFKLHFEREKCPFLRRKITLI